jgi:hypothetical protein
MRLNKKDCFGRLRHPRNVRVIIGCLVKDLLINSIKEEASGGKNRH